MKILFHCLGILSWNWFHCDTMVCRDKLRYSDQMKHLKIEQGSCLRGTNAANLR